MQCISHSAHAAQLLHDHLCDFGEILREGWSAGASSSSGYFPVWCGASLSVSLSVVCAFSAGDMRLSEA